MARRATRSTFLAITLGTGAGAAAERGPGTDGSLTACWAGARRRDGGPPAHPSNTEQARGWDGPGAFWAENADRFDAAVAAYQATFLDAAMLRRTDRVLDVGCGTGQTTRDVARRVTEGAVLGVDLSAEMLAVARARADRDGVGNVTFAQADVQIHSFGAGTVDRVVSRTGTLFFGDPPMAFANLARALVPGGLLVLLVWQPLARNPWMRDVLTAVTGPSHPIRPLTPLARSR